MNRSDLYGVLEKLLRASNTQVQMLLMRAPYQYKHYTIPKRTGGVRHIYHPTPNLKAIQRWMTTNLFCNLPIHSSVFSYRKGRSIKIHANEHLHSNFLLRLDFHDFFPSIDDKWLEEYLLKQIDTGILAIDADTIQDIVRLSCRYDKESKDLALSIGAPSSPVLSNAILFDADQAASTHCLELECIYTRYADDIYISSRTKGRINHAEKLVREAFEHHASKLHFNENKTINVSKKRNRIVTGVTLTPDRHLSIGRDLKRQIKTEVYLWINNSLPTEKMQHLCGLISYARDIEPEFYDSLCKKFGATQIEKLFHNKLRKEIWKEIPF